jgi:predicted hydrolase (HD superfamily)
MRNLQNVLVSDYGLDLTGWTLEAATDISPNGRTIVGNGTNPNGDLEAWIAIIPGPATACIDGLDNDGDGFTDYPDDPGCADADDLSERSPLLICDDGSDNDGDGLIVCPGEDGGFLEVSVWRRRVFANIARKVVGKGRTVTPHTLRHTYASIHLSRGTDLLWVQRQGGWQSPTVLLSTYAHFLPTELEENPSASRELYRMIPTREDAWSLLCEFNQSASLRMHALAVEGVMRHLARRRGGDEELWGMVGVLHDLDYERYPDEHCQKAESILRERGWPEEIIRAVLSHGWGICTQVEPESDMEKCLYAVDELTGLVTATALVRPSRSVLDMKAKSVKKKWKDARFAAGVDRSLIERGAELLGMPLEELIAETIAGMREVAAAIGLEGGAA